MLYFSQSSLYPIASTASVEGGKITADNTKLNISFKSIDPSKVTKSDIIGGYDTNKKKNTGFL